MADPDDMEMVECPVCKRRCPKDFYPLCNCGQETKGNKQARGEQMAARKKAGRRIRNVK